MENDQSLEMDEMRRMYETEAEITVKISELDVDTLNKLSEVLGVEPAVVGGTFLQVAMYDFIIENAGTGDVYDAIQRAISLESVHGISDGRMAEDKRDS